jgi:hypothetical protein
LTLRTPEEYERKERREHDHRRDHDRAIVSAGEPVQYGECQKKERQRGCEDRQ